MQLTKLNSPAAFTKQEKLPFTKKTAKKFAAAILFLILIFPAHANDRIQSFVRKYITKEKESVANAIADKLEENTGIKVEKEAMVVQLADFCETIIFHEAALSKLDAQEAAEEDVADETKLAEAPADSSGTDKIQIEKDNESAGYGHNDPRYNEEYNPNNYIYTLPYLTDDAVLVTRLGEDIEITKEINEGNSTKIYAGYENDSVFRVWLEESHFDNINEESKNIADALEFILDGKADFTILPYHMATAIISSTMITPRLTTSRTLFPVEYRFPIPKDDIESFTKINDELYKLEHDGTLVEIYYREGLKPNLVIEQESKLLRPAILNVMLLFLCCLGITYFVKYFAAYRKEKHKNDVKRHKEENDEFATITPAEKLSELTEKNTAISEQIAENENTDPYSGFYNTNFLKQRINECFIQYAKNGCPFCVVLINATNRKVPFEQTLQTMKEEISNLFYSIDTTGIVGNGVIIPNDIIAAHNGFGIFYILFPNTTQNDAIHLISRKNCRFQNFTLLEYKGQDQYEFLGGLSLW